MPSASDTELLARAHPRGPGSSPTTAGVWGVYFWPEPSNPRAPSMAQHAPQCPPPRAGLGSAPPLPALPWPPKWQRANSWLTAQGCGAAGEETIPPPSSISLHLPAPLVLHLCLACCCRASRLPPCTSLPALPRPRHRLAQALHPCRHLGSIPGTVGVLGGGRVVVQSLKTGLVHGGCPPRVRC